MKHRAAVVANACKGAVYIWIGRNVLAAGQTNLRLSFIQLCLLTAAATKRGKLMQAHRRVEFSALKRLVAQVAKFPLLHPGVRLHNRVGHLPPWQSTQTPRPSYMPL